MKDRLGEFTRLIERGLRAQLQMQSTLTGLLMINLDFMPDTPIRLVGTVEVCVLLLIFLQFHEDSFFVL